VAKDERCTILIAEDECSSAGRSKHIDIRYKFVAQTIADEKKNHFVLTKHKIFIPLLPNPCHA
jgi:hypothetical protein